MVETENRDPFPCPHCDTVNVWNATKCRDCGNEISKAEATSEALIDEENTSLNTAETLKEESNETIDTSSVVPHSPRRSWNVFWIVLGIAIHVAGIHIGVFYIIKYWIEPDPEVKTVIEKTLAAAQTNSLEPAALIENAKEPLKTKLGNIRTVLVFLLAVVPILIGMSAGFFSGSILDGAASMGLSAVLLPLFNGATKAAIIWGPINAGLGALGAFIGVTLARRFRPTGEANDSSI